MARNGVTFEAVEQAVSQIEARGEAPTYLAIRNELGGGSLTTIGNHLKEIRTQRVSSPSMKYELPYELKQDFNRLMEQLWRTTQVFSAQDVEYLRRAANGRVEAIEKDLELLTTYCDEMADQLKEKSDELVGAQQEIKIRDRAKAHLEGEKAALEKQVAVLTRSVETQAASFERWMSQGKETGEVRKSSGTGGRKGKTTELPQA